MVAAAELTEVAHIETEGALALQAQEARQLGDGHPAQRRRRTQAEDFGRRGQIVCSRRQAARRFALRAYLILSPARCEHETQGLYGGPSEEILMRASRAWLLTCFVLSLNAPWAGVLR